MRVSRSDTKQEFVNGEIGSEVLYLWAPDWLLEGSAGFGLMKIMYGTRQAAIQSHLLVSTLIESRDMQL